ncbi:MAG: hypothetical protein IPG76_05070 [Acidobacteria bacterium]|nr:hypothetical protein [Acidobacteriota bacterium]
MELRASRMEFRASRMEFRLQAELFAEIITRRLQKVPPEGGTPCVELHAWNSMFAKSSA